MVDQKSAFTGQFTLLTVLLCLLCVTPVFALKAGLNCSDCHTMHHSQGGQALSSWGDAGPYNALLVTDCAGCHSGDNAPGSMPYITSFSAPIYGASTLAGGSFYWVSQPMGDSAGHNVFGLTAVDATLGTPPGFNGAFSAADGSVPGAGSWSTGQQVTCAGVYGCHGSHTSSVMETAIFGGHHDNLSGAISSPGSKAGNSYRMLVGVAGYEDPAWELTPTATAHNQYKGLDGATDDTTISSLCMRCHGEFHQQSGFDVWTQHPVEYDLSNTAMGSEYRDFGGLGHDYQIDVPLGSTSVLTPLGSVSLSGGEAVITCITCHRAHGSPYYKMLRWNYAATAGEGCVVCHTSKS